MVSEQETTCPNDDKGHEGSHDEQCYHPPRRDEENVVIFHVLILSRWSCFAVEWFRFREERSFFGKPWIPNLSAILSVNNFSNRIFCLILVLTLIVISISRYKIYEKSTKKSL